MYIVNIYVITICPFFDQYNDDARFHLFFVQYNLTFIYRLPLTSRLLDRTQAVYRDTQSKNNFSIFMQKVVDNMQSVVYTLWCQGAMPHNITYEKRKTL